MSDDPVDSVNRKIDEVAQKVDALSASVDRRFDDVDKRFNEHFVEQRQYTEFAFDTLRREMHAGFEQMNRKFDAQAHRLDEISRQLTVFIETQGGINRDHHDRIVALERRGRPRRKT